jgi:hypothetical protein
MVNPSLDELDGLLADPSTWPVVDPEVLRHLLFYQCLSYGLDPEDEVIPRLMALARVAVERLHPAARRQVAIHVARAIERVHRAQAIRDGAGCTNGLLPFLVEDPDPSVVSAAATEMAALMPVEDGDPLTGPTYVRSLLDELPGEDARAGIVAGLLQLGDSRVAPLVAGAWRRLGDEGRQTLALLVQGIRGLSALTAEFLVAWLEDEVRTPSSPAFGIVTATLARAGGHAADHGVVEFRRTLPVTEGPEGESDRVVREWTRDDYVATIRERLLAIAAAEQPPHLMLHVLRYWGLTEAAYRLAVAAAAGGRAGAGGALLPEPAPLEITPDWDDGDEVFLEWGTVGSAGPAVETLRATRLPDQGVSAVVHSAYHPSRSVSALAAVLPLEVPAGALAETARAFFTDGARLERCRLAAPPDYVHVPAGSPVALHDVSRAIWDLHAGAAASGDAAVPGADPYRRWIRHAGASAHVTAVRAAIPDAWARAVERATMPPANE